MCDALTTCHKSNSELALTRGHMDSTHATGNKEVETEAYMTGRSMPQSLAHTRTKQSHTPARQTTTASRTFTAPSTHGQHAILRAWATKLWNPAIPPRQPEEAAQSTAIAGATARRGWRDRAAWRIPMRPPWTCPAPLFRARYSELLLLPLACVVTCGGTSPSASALVTQRLDHGERHRTPTFAQALLGKHTTETSPLEDLVCFLHWRILCVPLTGSTA